MEKKTNTELPNGRKLQMTEKAKAIAVRFFGAQTLDNLKPSSIKRELPPEIKPPVILKEVPSEIKKPQLKEVPPEILKSDPILSAEKPVEPVVEAKKKPARKAKGSKKI